MKKNIKNLAKKSVGTIVADVRFGDGQSKGRRKQVNPYKRNNRQAVKEEFDAIGEFFMAKTEDGNSILYFPMAA